MSWSKWDSIRHEPQEVARAIRDWVTFVPDSPLYRHLALAAAEDPDLRAVVASIDNVPPMNLLFGAVKYLLTPEDPLAQWYPHLTAAPRLPNDQATVAFRTFALDRAQLIAEIGATRRTQTNEVARCALILPWVAQASRDWTGPIHAVDVGASAGLNLCMEAYAYRYGEHRVGGGDLLLECENRGEFPVPAALPTFATRTGLDLAPVDATDPDQVKWLEALVWPEHTERLARLRAAIAQRAATDITMIAGDAAQSLRELDRALPDGPMLVWHTIALYQFSGSQVVELESVLADIATRRPLARVGLEPTVRGPHPEIRVGLTWDSAPTVATAHAHGAWLDAPPATLAVP